MIRFGEFYVKRWIRIINRNPFKGVSCKCFGGLTCKISRNLGGGEVRAAEAPRDGRPPSKVFTAVLSSSAAGSPSCDSWPLVSSTGGEQTKW